MFNSPRLRIVCLSALLVVFSATVIRAQHEASGGSTKGMMGGGTVGGSTGRPANKPVTKPKPPVRKPPATTTTTTPVRKPTTTSTSRVAEATPLVAQGDQLYAAKNYKEALVAYQKAVDINPNLANAQYRIGWIQNDLEDYDEAIPPLQVAARLQPSAVTFYELGYSYKKTKPLP